MIPFNVHHGQTRTRQWVDGERPVAMFHRAMSPKRSISFPSYGEYGGVTLEANLVGVIEASDPYCVMTLMDLGWPLHEKSITTPIDCDQDEDSNATVARAELARVGDERVLAWGQLIVPSFEGSVLDLRKYLASAIPNPWQFFGVARSYRSVISLGEIPDGLTFPRPDRGEQDPYPDSMRMLDSNVVESIEELIYEPLTWLAVHNHMVEVAGG